MVAPLGSPLLLRTAGAPRRLPLSRCLTAIQPGFGSSLVPSHLPIAATTLAGINVRHRAKAIAALLRDREHLSALREQQHKSFWGVSSRETGYGVQPGADASGELTPVRGSALAAVARAMEPVSVTAEAGATKGISPARAEACNLWSCP